MKKTNEYIDIFLKDCRQRLNKKTVYQYQTILHQFSKHFSKKKTSSISKLDVRNYLNTFKKKKYTRSTIENKLIVIRSFFDYVRIYHNINMPKLDDINIHDYPKAFGEGRTNKSISKKDIRVMIEEAESIRDTLILSLLFYTGLRANEISKIKLEDIDTKERVLKIVGKGDKPRYVPYSKILDRLIHRWLRNDRKSYVHSDSPYFFPSKHNKFLTTRRIYEIVTKYAKKAGIQKKIGERGNGNTIKRVHPHILRHSYATHAVADGVPLEHLKELMGHSNIHTTMHYAGNTGIFDSYKTRFKGL